MLAISALAAGSLLAACGDDDGETTVTETVTASTEAEPTTSATETTATDEAIPPAGGESCSSETEATGVTTERPGYIAVRAVDADCEDALAVAQAWIDDWDLAECENGCVKDVLGFSCTYGGVTTERSRAPEVECVAAHSIVTFSLFYP